MRLFFIINLQHRQPGVIVRYGVLSMLCDSEVDNSKVCTVSCKYLVTTTLRQ